MRFAIAMLLLSLIVGCDTVHGVRRTASFPGNMSPNQVVATVKRVTEVTSRTHPGRDVWTLYGKRHEPAVEQISYRSTNSIGGTIELRLQANGRTDFQIYSLGFSRMSDNKIADIRKTMDAIYRELTVNFTNLPPAEMVEETIMK